ncbi:family 16 glycosylhydrolase [Gillisia sp. CAL575]|uniref:glycoside hydrolase family 16 protein n=1 Tax=Gillisia sp. CAL575 TaxID=985255 RepID=UPI0003A423A9|nr:glycoside hydrolase family 16 protein [Gillisia sp. CAL575]
MKNIKSIIFSLMLVFLFVGCDQDDYELGKITVPTGLNVTTQVVGATEDMPFGDGSGMVTFKATANGAMNYKFIFSNGSSAISSDGDYTHQFSESGVSTNNVSIIAYGAGGASSSKTVDVDVLVTYSPPQDLIDKLVGDGAKEWRIKADVPGHFGLGPVGGVVVSEWYSAGPNEKAAVGMYDDRYIFGEGGTFTHITNNTNDDPTLDPSGTVFGRVNLIDQLGVSGGEVSGADVLNLPYSDYSVNWSISAPGGAESINLTGIGFIGYYIGGNHRYEIFDRSVPNELILKSTDGNGEFDWWFILTADSGDEEEPEEQSFQTEFTDLLWSDEFDGNALDTANWNYEIGNGDNGWGNGEAQYYTNSEDNVKVQDGNLVITAKRESESGFDFTSARITTKDKFEFTYGRIEVKAKMPGGGGTWPAIWMLGANFSEVDWPATGEIDIMEWVGNNPIRTSSALHFPGNSGGNASVGETTITNATSEFHTYTAEWTEENITFLLDGEVYFIFDNDISKPFNKDFFLILNVAMGGTLGGTIADDFQESSMEIDYVRVYQ